MRLWAVLTASAHAGVTMGLPAGDGVGMLRLDSGKRKARSAEEDATCETCCVLMCST